MNTIDERLTGGYAKPEDLMIVGIDEIPAAVKDAHELEDKFRIDGPEDGLVKSVEESGVRIPVLVRSRRYKADGVDYRIKIVIAGRQRVLAARQVNAKRKAKGDDYPCLVPFVIKEGDESTVILDNQHRRVDPPWVNAYNLKRLLNRNVPMPEAMAHFSENGKPISRQTADAWLRLLKLTPEILAEVKAGDIPYATAYELGKHPPQDQGRILKDVRAADGTIKGANGVANVKAVAAMPPAPSKPAAPPPKDPALTPRREHVEHPPPKAPIVKNTKTLTPRALAIVVDVLAPTETEPHENDEQRLAYAVFGVCSGAVDITALDAWPWIAKIVKKAMK